MTDTQPSVFAITVKLTIPRDSRLSHRNGGKKWISGFNGNRTTDWKASLRQEMVLTRWLGRETGGLEHVTNAKNRVQKRSVDRTDDDNPPSPYGVVYSS